MKKTLIITLEFPPTVGGIASYVDQMAASLDPAETIVLAPEVPGMATWDATRPYTILRRKFFFPKPIWPRWYRLLRHTKAICKQYGVERILVHHMLPAGYVAMRMKRSRKIPFLVFSHGTDFVYGTATPHKARMTRMVFNAADAIICNSQSLQTRLLEKLPGFENKTNVLYPCPNPNFFAASPEAEIQKLKSQYGLEGKNVLLSVSRLVSGKGFAHLLRLMPELLSRCPNLIWFIAGDGEKRPLFMKMIRERNLQNIVRYIGEVPHEQLAAYYDVADLFVLLTHPYQGIEEGLGLVFLEAAASGLPVVAGRSGGVSEAVAHNETGYVVDADNQEEVMQAITTLLTDEEKRHTFARAARARTQSTFVWETQLGIIRSWLT